MNSLIFQYVMIAGFNFGILLLKKYAFALGTKIVHLHLQPLMQEELLNRLETDLRSIQDLVRTQIADKPEEALKVRPDLNSWNSLECIAHLNLFMEMYLPRIEKSIHLAKARSWKPGNQLKYTGTAKRVLRQANPANNKPRKTAKRYDFIHQPIGTEVIKPFLINNERLLRNVQASRVVDLNKAKIGWGPSGFYKVTLGNCLEWLVLHSQRHLQQAMRTINS